VKTLSVCQDNHVQKMKKKQGGWGGGGSKKSLRGRVHAPPEWDIELHLVGFRMSRGSKGQKTKEPNWIRDSLAESSEQCMGKVMKYWHYSAGKQEEKKSKKRGGRGHPPPFWAKNLGGKVMNFAKLGEKERGAK